MQQYENEVSGAAFVLASLLTSYPDEQYSEYVNSVLSDPEIASYPEIQSLVKTQIANFEGIEKLKSDYIDLFDRGKEVVSLYETEYGRDRALVKGNELVDIAGFYRAFGFENGADGTKAEMLDHLAVQLEFYALLKLKTEALTYDGDQEGVEIVLDARKKFLKDHLGRFPAAICQRPKLMDYPYYHSVMKFSKEIVSSECKALGVDAEMMNWAGSPKDDLSDVSCGGSIGCVK